MIKVELISLAPRLTPQHGQSNIFLGKTLLTPNPDFGLLEEQGYQKTNLGITRGEHANSIKNDHHLPLVIFLL